MSDGKPRPENTETLRFGVPNSIDVKIWRRLDPQINRLTGLKLEKARKKYRRGVEDETRQIYFDKRGNANSMALPDALLRMHLKKADEFADQQYSIFRDVWLKLGGTESAAFIRTISWMVIQRPFDAHRRNFEHEEKRRFRRSGGLHPRVSPETIRKGFDGLKAEWREKLEIKALEWEAEALGKGSNVEVVIPKSQERIAEPQSAERTPCRGKSASRRQGTLDARKVLIAELKARNPNSNAREICELIDQVIDKAAPIRRGNLAPLKSWKTQAPSLRSWVEFYDHSKTHNPVRTYVNKVPALQTSAKSSK